MPKTIDQYIEQIDTAEILEQETKEPKGDRYNGYSGGYTKTKYKFDDGVILQKYYWYEPGDMFSGRDSCTYYNVLDSAGLEFDSLSK